MTRPLLSCGLQFALALVVLAPAAALAGSYVLSHQPTSGVTEDSYGKEDSDNNQNGDKNELKLKTDNDPKNEHIFIRIPTPTLSGKTILQAWLRLTHDAASSSTPIDARIYPLLQSWNESQVTWASRSSLQPWTVPGGTHGSAWSDRRLVGESTVGSEVSWQVGPILQAWQLGTLAANGLVIVPVRGAPEREHKFDSSDEDPATVRPRLVIHYTDEAPAIRSGWAETQPRALRAGSTNSPLTLWLDVDAAGATPTGAATGLDQITIGHQGAFVVTALASLTVNGAPVPTGQVTWSDNGTSATFRIPRVRAEARIGIGVLVTTLSGPTTRGIDLPVTVDDTATPGAWAQALWPGNADGSTGNGDDWIMNVTSSSPIKIRVLPDTARVVERDSTSFTVMGEDGGGAQFSMDADSFRVVPSTAGLITSKGHFTALNAGVARVIAHAGSLRDTAIAIISPPLTPEISTIQLRNRAGVPVAALVPADTMLLDVTLRDGDGFKDVEGLEFDFAHAGHESDLDAPAFRATYRWTRAAAAWALLDPVGTSWAVVPGLCAVDTATNSTAPQTIRLAFVTGRIARASSAGEWSVRVRAHSVTPYDTTTGVRTGLDAAARITFTSSDTAAAFNSGPAGAAQLPLSRPTDGELTLGIVANASWSLEGAATDLVGVATPTETMFVRSPNQRIRWDTDDAGPAGGYLDTSFGALLAAEPAATSETATQRDLRLWINHSAGASPQDYRGDLALRVVSSAFGQTAATTPVRLTASVVPNASLPAQSVLAEIAPHQVPAGTAAQPFDVWLLPQIQAGNGGIDRILVDLPSGYGATSVATVLVAGAPVAFTDVSTPGMAGVTLATRVASSVLVRLRVLADVPTALDSSGSSLVVLYDDTATPLAPQAAFEGNANGVSDANSWDVAIVPGALAALEVTPAEVTAYVGDEVGFSAAGFDAYGHPVVAPAITWSVEGGVGTIGASGTLVAAAAGGGRVIASSGGVADTAIVVVWPARAIAVRSVIGPVSVHQGQATAALGVRIENLGAVPVVIDTLRLSFSRGSLGDADADFVVTPSSGNPDTLPVGSVTRFDASVAVSPAALLGPLAVNARASGLEVGGTSRLTDSSADTALTLTVTPGGYELIASQPTASVRPGQADALLMTLRMRNLDPAPRTLTHLVLTNRSSGPGDPETLDGELGDVALFVDDGDGIFESPGDTLALVTSALSGRVRFAPLAIPVGPGSERRLFVAVSPPLSVRDGDRLDVVVDSAGDVRFSDPLQPRGSWPVDPPGALLVDGLVADQVAAMSDLASALRPGVADQAAFHLRLPANGYQPDVLQRLAVINRGTAQPVTDIAGVRAWADDGDDVFEVGADRSLGRLTFTGDRWELTGLSEGVPLSGLALFFTVDLTALAGEGRTVRLALTSGPDPGVGMASGNTGPLDRELETPVVQTVSHVDRVTLTAMPLPSGDVRPGETGRPLLHLVASNSYAASRTLTAITLTSLTTGPGAVSQRDREIRMLTLRGDGDGDGELDAPDVDPILATGFLSSGRVDLTGLAWSVPASQSSHLFVTADVSLDDAADGDVLACAIEGPAHVGFAEPTTVTALWPLDSQARWRIDGAIAAQIRLGAVPAQTIGPADARVLALDLVMPPNGYQPDILRSLAVTNLGSATAADVSAVELWQDGGDGVFSSGTGDDVLLGPLTPLGPRWQSPLLSAAVVAPGLRLFVSVSVGGAPAESSTVRLGIPVGGIQMESGNDGPVDQALAAPDGLLISGSPLLVTLEIPPASALGQTVEVRMVVRNTSSERVTGIQPTVLALSGPGVLSSIDGPTPAAVDLDPGARDTMSWRYTAAAVGELRVSGGAAGTGTPSGLERRAPAISSPLHRVFGVASRLDLSLVHTMPVSVNPGAIDVVPFSLTLTNPGGQAVSDVNLKRLRVRVETELGQPIVPADLLARVVVNEGTNVYLVKTALETSGNEIDLTLGAPARVTGMEPTTLNLRLDLLPATSIPTFRIVIRDSTDLTAEDGTTLAPVALVTNGGFPIRSNVARIVAEATDLDVAALAPETLRVARAAVATLSRTRFENRGTTGITSDVRLAAFTIGMRDGAGAPIVPGTRIQALRVLEGSRVLTTMIIPAAAGPEIDVPLSPPLNLPVNTPMDLVIEGTVAAGAPLGAIRIVLTDSSRIDAYDASTRAQVAVHMTEDPLAGALVMIEADASSVAASHSSTMPASIVIGESDVDALSAALRHPGAPGTARIRVDSLRVVLRDELRRPLVMASHVDRVRVRWNGTDVASVSPSSGSGVSVPLSVPLLEAGDTARFELLLDVDGTAPAGSVELVVAEIHAVDANRNERVATAAESGFDLPMLSGLGRLVSPSRELTVGLASRMPIVLASDGRSTTAAELSLSNSDPQGSGAISVDWLRVNAADQDYVPKTLGAVAERVEAWIEGALWGRSAPLTADSASAFVEGLQRLQIPRDGTVRIELRWIPRTTGAAGRVRLGLDRPDVGVVQPAGALLAVAVLPGNGQSFPLWSAAGGFTPTDLSESYANFPNPFAAGRQVTAFSYYLRTGGRVSLRILTPRGVRVATLLDGVSRGPGLHQDDRWNGRNGTGSVVLNGIYVAELAVSYDDGSSERHVRKVAVVR